jgi:Glycosyl hydrolases family 35
VTIDVSLQKGRVMVGERTASLLSGAVHYWRLHPNSWENVLKSVKEMGLETIDTYIPWEFHEIERNHFDFSGETDSRRNLSGFMQLTREMGLWVVIRPGPYIYSEWVNMGVPTDVAGYHRLHPEFTARAGEYIRAVSQVLVPYLATNGGHIILVQVDNETDAFEYCYEEQLGLAGGPGLFQRFLQEKYGSLDNLNQRWGANYQAFDEAHPVMSAVDLGREYRNRYFDFFEFRATYINRCVEFYAEAYRRNGIDVPTMHNLYDIYNVQNFRGLSQVVDLVGVDSYPANEFRPKTLASDVQISHRHLSDVFRYLRTFSETAYIAEYEAGIGHGLHYKSGVLTPNQYTLTFLTAVQAGIHALNWYMLVDRDNWMMCPINEWGRKNLELFRVFQENVDLYQQMNVPDLVKLTGTSVFFYLGHRVFEDGRHDPTLNALYESGVDYELFNIETSRVEKPLLFYSGASWLPRAEQEKLRDYTENGGNLVFFQSYPTQDENGNKLNLLDIRRPSGVTSEPFLDHLATETEVELGDHRLRFRGPFHFFSSDIPWEPIMGTRVDADIPDTKFEENQYLRSLVIGHRYVVGYHEKRGAGSITVLGAPPTAGLVIALHRYLDIPIYLHAGAEAVKSALFRGGDNLYAVLVNLGEYPVNVPVDLAPQLLGDGDFQAVSQRPQFTVDDSRLSRGRFYVHIPRKEGTVIKIFRRENP